MQETYFLLNNQYEWHSLGVDPNNVTHNMVLEKRSETVEAGPGRGVELDSALREDFLARIRKFMNMDDIDLSEFNPPSLIKLTLTNEQKLNNEQINVIKNVIQEMGL
jgi:hypothetical protein